MNGIGGDVAVRVERGAQFMPRAWAVKVVADVVFARPDQLDRHAGLHGDGRGLNHVVVFQPPAKTAAGAAHMDDDLVARDAERLRH